MFQKIIKNMKSPNSGRHSFNGGDIKRKRGVGEKAEAEKNKNGIGPEMTNGRICLERKEKGPPANCCRKKQGNKKMTKVTGQ